MIEIIPTILVKEFEEVKKRIKCVEKYVKWVQLDVMDGIFVENTTWPYSEEGAKISDFKKIKSKTKTEVHLMIQGPEKVIKDWLEVTDRVIVHYESDISNSENAVKNLIETVHKANKQIGLAINPETDVSAVKPFFKKLDLVLIMTVQPGRGGQEFKEWILEKIKVLREMWPNGNIEVDGGINPETAKKVIEAGANLICAGTYIFTSKDVKIAINNLKNSYA